MQMTQWTPRTPVQKTPPQWEMRAQPGLDWRALGTCGEMIKARRKMIDMSTAQLAARAGLSLETLVNIEADRIEPSAQQIESIGRVSGLTQRLYVRVRRDLILRTIREFVTQHYSIPTLRQLCVLTQGNSMSSIRAHINALIDEGKLLRGQQYKANWYAVPEVVEAIKAIEWS
mgnify:CR=1 FL=1